MEESFRAVLVSQIELDPGQPRKDPGELEDLKRSIRERRVQQPPVVTPLGPDRHQLVLGWRCYLAVKALGEPTIQVIVRTVEEHQRLFLQLVENLQRVDLDPFELADAFRRLMDQHGLSEAELGAKVGKKQSEVSRILSVANGIPAEMRAEYYATSHKPSLALLVEIARAPSPALQRQMWEQARDGPYTVKQARAQRASAGAKGGSAASPRAKPAIIPGSPALLVNAAEQETASRWLCGREAVQPQAPQRRKLRLRIGRRLALCGSGFTKSAGEPSFGELTSSKSGGIHGPASSDARSYSRRLLAAAAAGSRRLFSFALNEEKAGPLAQCVGLVPPRVGVTDRSYTCEPGLYIWGGTSVNIYQLREPRRHSDPRGRSVEYDPTHVGLPGVSCRGEPGGCGDVWATSLDRIRIELPDNHPLRGVESRAVSPARLRTLQDELRRALGLPSDLELKPGTDVGFVRVRCLRPDVPAFEWPKVHTVLITGPTRQFLALQGLGGWHTAPVIVTESGVSALCQDLLEFVVDGRAGVAWTEPAIPPPDTCEVCGRVQYEKVVVEQLRVDPTQWDGSDFFRFSPPLHGYIFVSERAKDVLAGSPLDNYELISVDQFLDERRPENFGR
jgi:ParB family transcriptional regulator, chromosome partitioning protein